MRNIIDLLRGRQKAHTLQSQAVARACGAALRDIGLHVPGSVFQLRNGRTESGWMVNLKVPAGFSLPAVEMLALRLFLVRRVSEALKLAPGKVPLLVSFNMESGHLPYPNTLISQRWLQTRMTERLASFPLSSGGASTPLPVAAVPAPATPAPAESAMAVSATPSPALAPVPKPTPEPPPEAEPPHTAFVAALGPRLVNSMLTPTHAPLVYAPEVKPELSQAARPAMKSNQQVFEEINQAFDEVNVSGFADFDGSLSDFQRAYG